MRREAAGELTPAPAALTQAIAATGAGIVVADATVSGFPLTYVNRAFEELTGYRAKECLGRSCGFLQGSGTDPAAVAELRAALQAGRETRVVLLNHRKDGSSFFNELRLSPVRDDQGRIVQFIGVQNDVSELVHAARALADERDRAVFELRALRDALTPAGIPVRPRLELACEFRPAEQGVSGDFHLIAPGPGDATIMVVGDASGHGLQAARRATFVRAVLAAFARFTDDPGRLLELANHSLIEKIGTSAEFVTAVCAVYDPRSERLCWSSAGHAVPLDLDTGRPIGPAGGAGIALGIALDLGGTTQEAHLPVGGGVLLSTDGLSEARSAERTNGAAPRLGEARVAELLAQEPGMTPRRAVDELGAAAAAHTGGSLADDLCLLAARAT